jgi:hypothetical protein
MSQTEPRTGRAPRLSIINQDEELEERLDASVKRILANNRHLAEELRLHVQARV